MIAEKNGMLVRRCDGEFLQIEAWGDNALRVRATNRSRFLECDHGALSDNRNAKGKVEIDGDSGTITNGKITCKVLPTGKLKFFNQKGELLLEEYDRNRFRENIVGEFNSALEIDPRMYEAIPGTSNFKLSVRFEANEGEKIYGMGQYQQPYLDLKGCVIELAHRNSQACVPFYISNRNYGFLWNNPAIGNVVFGKNVTEWTAHSAAQVDYWITAEDSPAKIE
jgi:alpha-D-xyloside xylohydrolase